MTQSAPKVAKVYSLAWPIALNAVLLQLILVIDTVLVTPLGEEALSAMGVAASIGGIILGLLFAFSNGSQLVLAQAFGAQNSAAVSRAFRSGRLVNGVISATGIVFIFTASESLIYAIADTTAMAEMAYDYLRMFSVVTIGVALCQNITVYFNATGNSRIPFYANVFELPVNVATSLLFIYGLLGFPELGLTGAALGTAIAVLCRTLFLTIFFIRKQRQDDLIHDAKPDALTFADVKHHLKFATPIAGTFVSAVLANSLCMLIYAKLGVNQFAALTLIAPWIKVAGHLSTAWAQATSIIVGQLLGNKSLNVLDGFISKAWTASFFISIVISAAYLGMFFLFEVMYPDLQPETLQTLWLFMPILVVLPFIRASNTFCGNVLRAGGDATHVFKIHAYTQWFVIVPLSALFVLYFEFGAVWVFGLILLEELIKGVPFHLRMHGGQWKRSLV